MYGVVLAVAVEINFDRRWFTRMDRFFRIFGNRASAACDSAADDQVAFPELVKVNSWCTFSPCMIDPKSYESGQKWFLSDFQQHLSAADPYPIYACTL